jgi:hypothetical protein
MLRDFMPGQPETLKGVFLVAGSALVVAGTSELSSGDIFRGASCLVAGLIVFAIGEKVFTLF